MSLNEEGVANIRHRNATQKEHQEHRFDLSGLWTGPTVLALTYLWNLEANGKSTKDGQQRNPLTLAPRGNSHTAGAPNSATAFATQVSR